MPSQAEENLIQAAEKGDLATLKRLVTEGVNVEATNTNPNPHIKFGSTALMKAARYGKLGCLEHLIAKGANLNAQDDNKRTALHLAALERHAPCAESLLKAGADASLKDNDGDTALDDAKSRNHPEVVKLLENFAAQATAKKYGLLEPLDALELGADELSRVTAAAVAYCDAKGSRSVADLVEYEQLDGLVASLALKDTPAKRLLRSLKPSPPSGDMAKLSADPMPQAAAGQKANAGCTFISARFDGKEKEHMAREIEKQLKALGVNTYMVDSSAGEDFGTMVMKGLANMDVMVAVCYDDYGEKTANMYCTYYELKKCFEGEIPMIPVRLSKDWPPTPPGNPKGAELTKMVFGQSMVYVSGAGKSAANIAAEVKAAITKLKKK